MPTLNANTSCLNNTSKSNAAIDLSVVIPSYDSQDTLARCLNGIVRQQGNVRCEVIVVDCSADDQVAGIVAKYPMVRLIREEARFAPGIGRNIGVRDASGRLILFVDADVIVEQGAIEQAWRSYQSGCHVFSGALTMGHLPGFRWLAALEHYYFNHQYQPGRQAQRRQNLSSALMGIDRELFVHAGGFADIPRMQDTAFTERLARDGARLFFLPLVMGQQVQTSSVRALIRKIFINGNNVFFIRYGQRATPLRKLLLAVALPLMTVAKMTRINLRNLYYHNPKGKLIALVLSPAMYGCGVCWMLGFYNGILFGRGISKQR